MDRTYSGLGVVRLGAHISLIWLALSGSEVFAHVDPGDFGKYDYDSFSAGLFHPVLGWDHLLAMFCVGVLSAQIGGSAIWKVPGAFVSVMLLGGISGLMGFDALRVEMGIAWSVILLGVSIAASGRLPTRWAMIFVGFFGFFHGLAHGLDIPLMAQPALYVSGFISGTALIHVTGVLVGWVFTRREYLAWFLRGMGGVVSVAGLHLLFTGSG